MLLEKQEIQTTLYDFTGIKNIDIQRLSVKRAELFEMWRKLSFYAKKSKIKRSKIISYKDSCAVKPECLLLYFCNRRSVKPAAASKIICN